MSDDLSLYEKAHYLHRCFRYKFRTEKQQIAKLLSYDLRDQVVFDVGGNHGIYTYWLAKAVGKNGRVHVFEPQPELGVELNKIAKWLRLDFVSINSVALSDQSTQKMLTRSRVGDGSATLNDYDLSKSGVEKIEIQTLTMDEYCQQQGVTRMGYLKIDVEGHELSVIRGGLQTLQKLKPIIQVELRVHEASCDQVIETLLSSGYTGFMCCDGQEVPIADYKQTPSAKFGFIGHRDFVFEPA